MQAIQLAIKDLKILFRDKYGLVYMFATPLMVIVIASFALSGMFNKNSNNIVIPVVLLDKGEYGKTIIEELEKLTDIAIETEYNDNGHMVAVNEGQTYSLVKKRKAAIIIPADFTANLKHNLPVDIIVLKDPADKMMAQIAENICYRIAEKINIQVISGEVSANAVKTIVLNAKKNKGVGIDPRSVLTNVNIDVDEISDNLPVKVVTEDLFQETTRKPTPFETQVPGYAIMFVLLGANVAAGSLLQEKEAGMIKRLLSMPVSRGTILLGKMLGNFSRSFLQTVVIFLVGNIVFGMWLGNNIGILLLLIIILCFSATGLGMFIASLCRTREQINGQGLLIVLAMSALGGSWWPLYITPEWMQKLAHVTLTAWAIDGFNGLLIYGYGLEGILKELIVLLLMGIVFSGIAYKRFKLD